MAAARTVDESNHRGLLSGLLSYVKAQNPPRFPEGAAGGALMLRPETRVSWIAEILPYLGHADWHVEPGYDWNNAQNQPVAKQPLPEVVNPVFGPATSPDGYPVTHYVGVAGVGEDAAQLPADDPRAGMFGYGRQTRQQDLVRGGANTIAVLGVQDQCGPWAQGGRATVRPLTRQPYINGPDGFGSGQPDGMVAGHGRRLGAFPLEGHRSARDGATGVGPRRRARRYGHDRAETAGSRCDPKPVPAIRQTAGGRQCEAAASGRVKPREAPDPKLQAKLDAADCRSSRFPICRWPRRCRLVSAMSTLPVSFDPDAMEELGVSLHDPISIDVAKTTVGKTLEAIAAKRNMAPVVENGQILLTSTAEHREGLRPIRYTVADLTGGDAQAAADLAALVQRLVVPESWQASGGRGTVEVTPDVLRITQTGHVHYQIIVFCEKLRVARGLPTKSRFGSEEVRPDHADRRGRRPSWTRSRAST